MGCRHFGTCQANQKNVHTLLLFTHSNFLHHSVYGKIKNLLKRNIHCLFIVIELLKAFYVARKIYTIISSTSKSESKIFLNNKIIMNSLLLLEPHLQNSNLPSHLRYCLLLLVFSPALSVLHQ